MTTYRVRVTSLSPFFFFFFDLLRSVYTLPWIRQLRRYYCSLSSILDMTMPGSIVWVEDRSGNDLCEDWDERQDEKWDTDSPQALPQIHINAVWIVHPGQQQTRDCSTEMSMHAYFHGNFGSHKLQEAMIWDFVLWRTTKQCSGYLVPQLKCWHAISRTYIYRDKRGRQTRHEWDATPWEYREIPAGIPRWCFVTFFQKWWWCFSFMRV